MAKIGTTSLPKFALLRRDLGLSKAEALGYLELIWEASHLAAKEGSTPRFSAEELEAVVEWEGEAGALARALVARRWLDEVAGGQLQPHDYGTHVPDFVRKSWARRRLEWRNNELLPLEGSSEGASAGSDVTMSGHVRTSADDGATSPAYHGHYHGNGDYHDLHHDQGLAPDNQAAAPFAREPADQPPHNARDLARRVADACGVRSSPKLVAALADDLARGVPPDRLLDACRGLALRQRILGAPITSAGYLATAYREHLGDPGETPREFLLGRAVDALARLNGRGEIVAGILRGELGPVARKLCAAAVNRALDQAGPRP